MLQYPAEPVTGSNHKKTQAHKQHNQDRQQYPKITRKNKHNQYTRNSQPTQRTPTLLSTAQPVAGGYRMQGALWAAGCILGG